MFSQVNSVTDLRKRCVVYTIRLPSELQGALLFRSAPDGDANTLLEGFLKENPDLMVLETFTESAHSNRQRNRWPKLKEAVDYCLANKTHLIITTLKNLTRNDAFTHQIFRLLGEEHNKNDINPEEFVGEIFCCDQPFVSKDNFKALVAHAKEQRKWHGELIKEGLHRTAAKSGNPHAAEVIAQVNRPKIDNAIVFALLLQPVIAEYESRGYSQRKMVTMLNEEGYTAPEGGEWVLSQFQKVLERIHINEAALQCEKSLENYEKEGLSPEEIVSKLNRYGAPPPKGQTWTLEIFEKVSERIKQIHDILRFHEFMLALNPILSAYNADDLDETLLMDAMEKTGVTPPVLVSNDNH